VSEAAKATRPPRVVVLGWGNVSRGDDAIGPLLLQRLSDAAWPGVETIEAYQLQIEHALDLVGADLVLFIDAGMDTPAPFAFHEIQPQGAFTASTHALLPQSVLEVYCKVQGTAPPPAFVLCVRGEAFELGAPLGALAADHLAQAWAWMQGLFSWPDAASWRSLALPGASITGT
jgi:hydrogenase maturation protease